MHVACPPPFLPVNLSHPTGAEGVAVRAAFSGDVGRYASSSPSSADTGERARRVGLLGDVAKW
jgi:hypothetical protein